MSSSLFRMCYFLSCFVKAAHSIIYMSQYIIWVATQENLSWGFLKKGDSNQSPQLQRLARKLEFRFVASLDMILYK